MRWLESAYPDRARGWVGFNVPMSHKITAACDLLLMPSRFEPCGLNQLYAMRYGTVPVAHATGGLRDTVLPFNPWEGGRCLVLPLQEFDASFDGILELKSILVPDDRQCESLLSLCMCHGAVNNRPDHFNVLAFHS